MRIPFRLVDVFTDRPLAGNQLCVVPESVDLDAEAMQAIAGEIGFAETTFVTEAHGDRCSMRIFTPFAETPFAGHPSLGTAYVLVAEGRVRSPVTQSIAGGEFEIEVDIDHGFARMAQQPPRFGPFMDDKETIAAALGLDPARLHPGLRARIVSTGIPDLMVPVRDAKSVALARPDDALLKALIAEAGVDCCYLFAVQAERRAKARMFACAGDCVEDSATGSAAGPLGAYLVEQGVMSPGPITVLQGAEIGRPSTLFVDVGADHDGWSIHVGGGVAKVGEGVFDLPF